MELYKASSREVQEKWGANMGGMVFSFLLAVAMMFIGIAVTNMITSLGKGGTISALLAGMIFLVAAFAWPQIASHLTESSRTSLVQLTSNAWVWFGMTAGVWLYLIANSLVLKYRQAQTSARSSKTQSSPQAKPPKLPELPELSPQDKEQLTRQLTTWSKRDPKPKVQFIYGGSDKAQRFARDLAEALTNAGWSQVAPPAARNLLAEIPKGVTIHSSLTDPFNLYAVALGNALREIGVDADNAREADLRRLDHLFVYVDDSGPKN